MKFRILMRVVGDRKAAAQTIAAIMNTESKYLGMPTAAYEAAGWTIDKECQLTSPQLDDGDTASLRQICEALVEGGYTATGAMTVQIFPEDMNIDRIELLAAKMASKATLIKKAFGTEMEPTAATTQDGFEFGFYNASLEYADVLSAAQFSIAVHNRAASQKRVTAKDKPSGNEKYDFRNFLNSMDCMGFAYKLMRKTLGKRLDGNSAFKSGERQPTEDAPPAESVTEPQD